METPMTPNDSKEVRKMKEKWNSFLKTFDSDKFKWKTNLETEKFLRRMNEMEIKSFKIYLERKSK